MLQEITLITSLLFSILYPFSFWISAKDPLKNNFHHFHTGLPSCVAGVTLVGMLMMNFSPALKIHSLIWGTSLLLATASQWSRTHANYWVMSLPGFLGISFLVHLLAGWHHLSIIQFVILLLGGAIFCSSLYTMNLGHWYLNVHGLPIKHLMNAVNVFAVLLVARLAYNIYQLFQMTVMIDGETLRLINFVGSLNGIFLCIALFFGTVFPFVSLYFVRGTLLVKSTQSATGILYAILCSVVIGDITYKYFWLKFGIVL